MRPWPPSPGGSGGHDTAEAEPEPEPEETGPDMDSVSWTVAVVVLNSDPGDGSITMPSEERLAALEGLPNVSIVHRDPARPATGSGASEAAGSSVGSGAGSEAGEAAPAEVPLFDIGEALATLGRQIESDTETGKQGKLEMQAEAEPDAEPEAEPEAEAEAEGEPEPGSEGGGVVPVEAEPEPEPVEVPDVVYVLVGFVQTEADAEAVLASDVAIDAVVNLRLPPEFVPVEPPTEEELQAIVDGTKAYIGAVLEPLLSALNGGEEADADEFYGRLESFMKIPVEAEDLLEVRAGLPEETVAVYDGQNYNGAALAEAIYDLLPLDEEEDLVAGSAEDAAAQIEAIFESLISASDKGLAAFVVVPEPEPEPEPVEAVVTRHMKHHLSENLAPDSWRQGIAWTLETIGFEDEAESPEGEAEGEAEAEPDEPAAADDEAAAAEKTRALSEGIAATVFEFAVDKFSSRKAYTAYVETVNVTDIAAAEDAPDLTYYHKILDAYETEGNIGVLHVMYCLVEQLAESAKNVEGEADMDTIGAFLSGAVQGFGAPALNQPEPAHTKDLVESKMTSLLPLPGRDRAEMPVAPTTEGERVAEASSLYPFMELHRNQVERALLRDSVRQTIVDFELERNPGMLASLPAAWDSHLSSRIHFEDLSPATMATIYQSAVSVLSPVTAVVKTYDGRHDRMILAMHTPAPPPTRVGPPTTVSVAIPGVPNLATWESGVTPESAYRVQYSRTKVSALQQTVFPLDSACVVSSAGSDSKRRIMAYSSDNVFGSTAGSGLFTSTLSDGTIISVEAGKPFCTVTLTDVDGLTVRLHGSGRVDILRAATVSAAAADHNGMPKDIWSSVVSKGSLVRKYDDDSVRISYRTGDISAYDATDQSWVDTNESGGRQKRPAAGGKLEKLAPIRTSRYTDHETNADVVSRQDRVKKNYHEDGSIEVEHADGIRMTTTPGCTVVSIPDCNMSVTVASSHTEVVLPDGGKMRLTWPVLNRSWTQAEMHGAGSLKPTKVLKGYPFDAKSTILVTRPDGSLTSTRDNVVTAAPAFPGGSKYTFDLNNDSVEVVDVSGSLYKFASDAEPTSVLADTVAAAEAEAETPSIESHVPRLFIVTPDGSGFEWCLEDRVGYWLSNCEAQGVLLTQPVPEEANSTTFTVSGLPRAVVRHPQLSDGQLSVVADGLEQFAVWVAVSADRPPVSLPLNAVVCLSSPPVTSSCRPLSL